MTVPSCQHSGCLKCALPRAKQCKGWASTWQMAGLGDCTVWLFDASANPRTVGEMARYAASTSSNQPGRFLLLSLSLRRPTLAVEPRSCGQSTVFGLSVKLITVAQL